MANLRYPVKTIAGVSISALVSLYGALQFYGEQRALNRIQPDPYKLIDQERRFAPIREIIPPDALVGYVSDLATDSTLLLTAQYALAPRLLVRNPSSAWVVGNFARPQNFEAFARARGLILVKEFPDGVILFRRPGS
jgi:hypothetical protein